jgi:hypothetical protein
MMGQEVCLFYNIIFLFLFYLDQGIYAQRYFFDGETSTVQAVING